MCERVGPSDRGLLLVGSRVTVRWLSGEIALETEYAAAWEKEGCETFRLAVLIATAKKLNVPARYGCIVHVIAVAYVFLAAYAVNAKSIFQSKPLVIGGESTWHCTSIGVSCVRG